MSRCFPFPPPGYVLSKDKYEALIESIKLREEKLRKKEKRLKKKEKRLEKKEKKEKKRLEKKDRRKDKKDKTNLNLDKSDIVKKDHIGQADQAELCHKIREAETELEKSSLTDELGHVVGFLGPTSSPGSTQSTNKRKGDFSPIDSSRDHGLRQPSTSAMGEQTCSTSGRTDSATQNKDGTVLRDEPEIISSTLKGCNNVGGKTGIKSVPNAAMQRMEMQYNNLLEDLLQPRSLDAWLYSEDLDWLFQDRNEDTRVGKRRRCVSESVSSCSRSSTLWPRGVFLHESGVYALPYTVPF